MRITLLIATLVLALGANTGGASAQHRHYHNHYNGGWGAPLVGGLIVGGILGSAITSQQPRYVYPPTVVEPYPSQPVCYRRRVGYDYYGYPVYRTVCE